VAALRFTLPAPARVSLLTAACLSVSVLLGAAPAPPAAWGAGGCTATNATPNAGNVEQVRAAVVCLVNRERERAGEGALAPNAQLQQAAQHHSEDMAARDYFEHVGPGGDTPLDRMRSAGYVPGGEGYEVGENIAWGTLGLSTPRAIVASWMASPEHRANILDPRFRDTGVGVSTHVPAAMGHGQPGGLYTQDFGAILTGRAARYSAKGTPRYNLPPSTTKRRNKGYGSTRRKVSHRHRLSARHRARHRRAAGSAGRKRAHQRPRRRRR
jgi:uncharacterized protein YkwD